jgi:xylan 1,4-beta-xylosidase
MELVIHGVAPDARATLEFVDQAHGNVLPHYAAMGKPLDPTEKQVEELNRETALGPPEERRLQNGSLKIELTPDALVLVTVQP